MTTYGYIRTSRVQEPGHPGRYPEVQHRDADVESRQSYADVAVSGTKTVSSRNKWDLLDQQLAQGDVLVVAAVDRLGLRSFETLADVAPA